MVASAGRGSSRVPALTKYEVLEELGHGGMATVYRAHDKRLARDVAVKVLHPHLKESSEIAHRFAAEAKAVAKLRHPNIVEVFDVSSEEDAEQYLVVEFVRGETLRKLLSRRGALPPEIGAALAVELLSALAHAHASGVVHRDVKPENVLLEHRQAGAPASQRDVVTPVPASPPASVAHSRRTPVDASRGERVIVKLTDFGIAKLLDAQGVTSTGQVLGSPAHMAPEQIEGGEVDGRADVFGLGVLLYECMVGHLPFEGNNPAQVLRRVLDGIYPSAEREKPTIGKTWSQILDRALARRAEDRYPDAVALRDAIKEELSRLGIATPRSELEAWFDDPEGWEAEHQKRLIEKLCDLGAAARRQGDAVAAAADYNRALAYAPSDPQLLRIVSSMHRAEARLRLVKRAGPLLLATVVLGTSAYVVASRFKVQPLRDTPPVAPPRDSLAVGPTTPSVVTPPSAASSLAAAPEKPSTIPTIGHARDAAAYAPPTKATMRTIAIGSVQPTFGVMLSIDGAPPAEVTPNQTFEANEKQHVLLFTCRDDLCEPRTVTIAPGETGESLGTVQLTVRPGHLVVEGEATHSYSVEEIPGLLLSPGTARDIPMGTQGSRRITVYDTQDPSKRQQVKVDANKQAFVSFKK
jgi:serine/threonine-protein kinase